MERKYLLLTMALVWIELSKLYYHRKRSYRISWGDWEISGLFTQSYFYCCNLLQFASLGNECQRLRLVFLRDGHCFCNSMILIKFIALVKWLLSRGPYDCEMSLLMKEEPQISKTRETQRLDSELSTMIDFLENDILHVQTCRTLV